MATLSAGIVNIALPTMSEQFGVSLESIQLVVSLYLLVLTCLLPVFGKLSDTDLLLLVRGLCLWRYPTR